MSPGPFLFALSHCYSTYFMLAFGYKKQWSRLILATAIANFALLGPFLLILPRRLLRLPSPASGSMRFRWACHTGFTENMWVTTSILLS